MWYCKVGMLDFAGPEIPVWVYCLTLYFCYGVFIRGPPLVIVEQLSVKTELPWSANPNMSTIIVYSDVRK